MTVVPFVNQPLNRQFERFDVLISAVIIALMAAIGGVIAVGDQTGVGAALIDPATDVAAAPILQFHSTSPIRVRFTEVMDTASVKVRFEPPLQGTVSWAGTQMTFTPQTGLSPGQTYQLTLEGGARAQNGRTVRQANQWQLNIAPLSAVYMAPAKRDKNVVPVNLWRVSPPAKPVQLTYSEYGIEDFAVSTDGSRIAFSQKIAGGKTDLYLLTLASGTIQRLTNCVDAACRAPAWSPDGTRIAYERANSVRLDSEARTWILELNTLQTEPLFAESELLGESPRWSPDGRRISVYDRNAGRIFLVELASGQRSYIETLENDAGQFAPGGQQLAYSQLVTTPQRMIRQVALADFSTDTWTIHPLSLPDDALSDDRGFAWHPDGKRLAVMRVYMDERATEQSQVYEINTTTGEALPLVTDPNYSHGALSWSPDGGQLLMQRYAFVEPNALPGIWVYQADSKSLTQIASNGFFPQWLP